MPRSEHNTQADKLFRRITFNLARHGRDSYPTRPISPRQNHTVPPQVFVRSELTLRCTCMYLEWPRVAPRKCATLRKSA